MEQPVEPESANVPQADAPRKSRWPRLRFSLATLILLATIVCLLVALWTTWRRQQEATSEAKMLRDEIQKYRDEMGYLTITDPSKAHAIGVPAHRNLQWQWRVYLPENRRFQLHVVTGGVPKEGVAGRGRGSGSTTSTFRSGESLIYAEVQKDRNGQWVFHVEEGIAAGSSTIGIHQTHERWIEGGAGWSTQHVNPGQTQTFEPGEPIVLLRLRVTEIIEKTEGGMVTRRATDEPCDGLMVWIESAP